MMVFLKWRELYPRNNSIGCSTAIGELRHEVGLNPSSRGWNMGCTLGI